VAATVRKAEILATLSIATDLAMGQPIEFALKSCFLAFRLGQKLDFSAEELRETFYVALLRYIGCNAETSVVAALFGDAKAQYESIFNRLLRLPDETLVYPAHDYKGDTVSTIGEERAHNPRLQVNSADEYVHLMNNLHLPNPKMMDVAVPVNMRIGFHQEEVACRGWALMPAEAMALVRQPDVALIDLREPRERERHGEILGSLHAPYPALQENLGRGGILHELAGAKRLVFYCAFGERSAMAVQAAQDAGLKSACHIHGGLAAWRAAVGPVSK